MKNRLMITAVAASVLISSVPIPVAASETNARNFQREDFLSAESETSDESLQRFNDAVNATKESVTMGDIGLKMGVDMDQVFASMQSSLRNGESVSFSDAINAFTSTPIQTDSLADLSGFGMDSSNTDFGMVNIQYEMMSEKMTNEYDTTDLSSDSANSIALLNKEYGDVLNGVSLDVGDVQGSKLVMPDYVKGGLELSNGMTIDGIMNSASKQINGLYSSAASSSGLNNIRNSINVSSIFNEAANWKSTIGDPSSLTLTGAMASANNLDQSVKDKVYSQYESNQASDLAKHNAEVEYRDKINMKDQKAIKSKPLTWKITHMSDYIDAMKDLNGNATSSAKTKKGILDWIMPGTLSNFSTIKDFFSGNK